MIWELRFVLHDDAVVAHGHDGVVGFFASGVECSGRKINVIRLPLQWGKAHVDGGGSHRVDATGFIIFAG